MPVASSLPENNTEDAKPSPMGKAKRRRLRRKKGSQPRLAALISPFQGKGLAWSFPPSRGRWKMPPHRLPTKKAYDTRMLFSPYCHFERKREIFFVRGQAKDVRIAASGKHRASRESEGRCFMQTALRKKTETGNEKDPSATLGSPFQGKGLAWTLPPSYGRRCPEGAEVGWGKRYSRHKAFPHGEGGERSEPDRVLAG